MIDTKTLLFAVCSLCLTAGCKAGPAKVCDKINALANEASASGDPKLKTMADEMKQESGTCLTRMKAMADADPKMFDEAAECIDEATELRNVVQCFFKAAMKGKLMPGEAKAKAPADDAAPTKAAPPTAP